MKASRLMSYEKVRDWCLDQCTAVMHIVSDRSFGFRESLLGLIGEAERGAFDADAPATTIPQVYRSAVERLKAVAGHLVFANNPMLTNAIQDVIRIHDALPPDHIAGAGKMVATTYDGTRPGPGSLMAVEVIPDGRPLPSAFLAAYVRESLRPDCLPEFRFEATLPRGRTAWFATREEAEAAIVEAVGKS